MKFDSREMTTEGTRNTALLQTDGISGSVKGHEQDRPALFQGDTLPMT